jgi:hypothetical protein
MGAVLFVKHRVASFDEWKKVFDGLDEVRKAHGWESSTVYRDSSDPHVVLIMSRVKDVTTAKRYAASPEVIDAMVRAGVQGAPEFRFFDVMDQRDY